MKPVSDAQYLESSLIGNILRNPDTYPVAAEIVRTTDFSVDSARKVWVAICSSWSAQNNDDLEIKIYTALDTPTDKQWMFASTSDLIPMRSSVKGFAVQVREMARARRLRKDLEELTAKTGSNGVSCDWVLEDLLSIYRQEVGGVDGDTSISAVMDRFKRIQAKNANKGHVGLRTGYQLLQDDYIVYQQGHLWVVGAWTSVGKSAWMIESICRFFMESENGRVAVFSTEMTEEQNTARILANRTGVNANVILSGKMLPKHEQDVAAQEGWLAGKSINLYTKTRNMDDIASQVRRLKHGGGVDLVFVDFIQNVTKDGYRDQYAMMSQIAKDLQGLAHDARCSIICLSQLPNHAGREDTGILEFKGAGEIAAACDVGVLMKRAKEDKRKILFDIRKNRHGKCGKYLMQYNESWTGIEEVEKIED